MDQKKLPLIWTKTLTVLFLAGLLTACFDWHDNNGASSSTATGVDQAETGADSGGPGLPADGTDNAAADPLDTAPDESASADTDPILIALSWQPTPGRIDGYIVHTGPSPETATAVITVTSDTSVEYDASIDLGLTTGEQSCFRIKAYNSEGQSGYSEAVCYTVQHA